MRTNAVLSMALVVSVGGCATGTTIPEAYRTVYQQGCESGYADGGRGEYGVEYDPERFAGDRDYRKVWTEGYVQCFAQKRRNMTRGVFFDFPFPFFDAH